eukprot:1786245-Prymnesium_polylepis.1
MSVVTRCIVPCSRGAACTSNISRVRIRSTQQRMRRSQSPPSRCAELLPGLAARLRCLLHVGRADAKHLLSALALTIPGHSKATAHEEGRREEQNDHHSADRGRRLLGRYLRPVA